jgi:hypothetical protein
MPPIVSKLKGEKNSVLYILRMTFCRLAPRCLFHLPFPSYCDVAQSRSYFASTVCYYLLYYTFDEGIVVIRFKKTLL